MHECVKAVFLLAIALAIEARVLNNQARVLNTQPAPFGLWPWSRVATKGFRPSAREGHASVEVGNRLYIIGGCVQEIKCFNDVHIFDTDTLTWSQVRVTGDAPEPRGGHSATLVGTDIFLFGGANSLNTYGDIYKLDLIKNHWIRAVSTGIEPGRTTNHAAAADMRGRIFVFGGNDADGNFLGDMWILDVHSPIVGGATQDANSFPVVWQKSMPTGPVPMARESHSLTLVDRKLILFGGYTSGGSTVNDVHMFNVDTQEWSIMQINGPLPPRRQAHAAARHGREVVVLGGCDVSDVSPVCYNDVWSLDMVGMQWNQRSRDVVTWFAREGHSASFVRGQLFTFGGCQLSAECFDDMAMIDTHDACPASCGGHGMCVNEQFCRCSPGFTGHDCMQPLTCPNDCGNHGGCSENGQCVCENGWTGPSCETELSCPGNFAKCNGHGVCGLDGSCSCAPGFFGIDCSQGVPTCTPHDCSGHGACSSHSQCVCHPGWSGPACNMQITVLVEKEEEPCMHGCCGHGQCRAGTCQCSAGWHGKSCAADQTAWNAFGKQQQEVHDALLREADAKRQQAEKSRSLVQVMDGQTVGEQGNVAQSVLLQMQQLRLDVESLLSAAADAERRASDVLRGDSEEAQAVFDDLHLMCPSEKGSYVSLRQPTLGAPKWQTEQWKHHEQQRHIVARDGKNIHLGAKGRRTEASNAPKNHMHAQKALPENKDFGVPQSNPDGWIGADFGECRKQENCFFRGVCKERKCYCQPGYYGNKCQFSQAGNQDTFSLYTVASIAGCIMVVAFVLTLIMLVIKSRNQRNKERELGFRI